MELFIRMIFLSPKRTIPCNKRKSMLLNNLDKEGLYERDMVNCVLQYICHGFLFTSLS